MARLFGSDISWIRVYRNGIRRKRAVLEVEESAGVTRFLKSNQDIRPVPKSEAGALTALMSFGEIVRESVAVFDENNRIKILEGPMMGFEGQIIKVDRRKGRAKVKLDLYTESYLVEFGFELLEKSPDKPK